VKQPKVVFVCQECGAQSPKWMGKCVECGAWNSFVEERAAATWVLSNNELLYETFGDRGTPAAIWSLDLKTRTKRIVHSVGDVPLARGLALSRSGTTVFFSQLDRWESNIVVADYEIVK